MSISFTRVIHQQISGGSILIDKIDRSQGNFSGYAQLGKQPVYVPYSNPIDSLVSGYVDLVQTDEVLLASRSGGSIGGLVGMGYISSLIVDSADVATPTLTSAANAAGDTTLGGTVFLSITPDITYVIFTNLSGTTQYVPQSEFTTHSATQIIIPDTSILIGSPTTGWIVQVKANSKLSSERTL